MEDRLLTYTSMTKPVVSEPTAVQKLFAENTILQQRLSITLYQRQLQISWNQNISFSSYLCVGINTATS